MRIKQNLIKVFAITSCIFSLSSTLTVYAVPAEGTDASGGSGSGQTSTSTDTGTCDDSLLQNLGISDENITKMKGWVAVMRADGYSDAAIAGVFSNACGESHCNPLAGEAKGGGIGLFQFTGSGATDIQTYCASSCSHTKSGVTCADGTFSICSDGSCQVAFMMSKLASAITSYGDRITKYNSFKQAGTGNSLTYKGMTGADTVANIPECSSIEDFKKATDPTGAAGIFAIVYERGACTYVPCGISYGGKNGLDLASTKHPNYSITWGEFYVKDMNVNSSHFSPAATIYKWLGNADISSNASAQAAADVAAELAANGIWSEEKFAKFTSVLEKNWEVEINAISRDNLDLQELESLDDWENNVNQQKVTIISILRKIVATVGIILVVWGLLLYLAYWVDTVNTLIPISLVVIFSLGKLEVLNEEETTWSLGGEENKGKRLTVNHRNICTICVLMIGAGVLILSGTVYFLIEKCFSIAKNILA